MDVWNLFEENTVDQVRAIERRTRNEIERKKEELRFLVGERYRELIVAADVIKTMSASVQEIHDSLIQLNSRCSRLQRDRHLEAFTGRRQAELAVEPRFELRVRRSQIGAQIKLLLDTPELIFSCLESQGCLSAAQLFFIASHVHTHLELNSDLEDCGLRANALLHWADISPLKKAVVGRCRELLAQPIAFSAGSLSERSLAFAEHLAALMLLNGLGVDAVIADFFSLRSQSIELTFRNLESETSKAQFLLVATNLLSSVQICHTLFSSSAQFDSGLLQRIVQEKLQLNTRMILAGLDGAQVSTRHLPPYVLAYQPVRNLEDRDLSAQEVLKAAADDWLERTKSFLNYQLVEALQFVPDLASLYAIRCALLAQFKEANATPDWSACCAAVFQRRLDLWSEIFQPVFHAKLTSLCESALAACFATWSEGLDCLLADIRAGGGGGAEDAARGKRTQGELDLAAYMWSESPRESLTNRLALLTPRLQALCEACRATVHGLLSSIEGAQLADGAAEDGQAAVRGLLDDFVGRCADRLQSLGVAEAASEHCLLALQRLAVAMATMLPGLTAVVSSRPAAPVGAGGHSRRQAAKADPRLRAAAEALGCTWLDGLCDRHARRFEAALAEEVLGSSPAFLTACARWDRRPGGGVSGGSAEAALVPTCASRPCHRLLLGLSRDLARRGGHALTRASLQHLLAGLTNRILAAADRCLSARLPSASPADAGGPQQLQHRQSVLPSQLAQLLFDLRFLFALLSRREETPANAEFGQTLEALVGRVEAAMDPFDLEAVAGPLSHSASRHAQACCSLYGLLASIDRLGAFAASRASPAAAAAAAASASTPQLPDGSGGPSVLPSAGAPVPRFGLLPVSARPLVEGAPPSGGKSSLAQPAQQQQQHQLKSVQTVPANLSSVRESPSFYNKVNSILFKS